MAGITIDMGSSFEDDALRPAPTFVPEGHYHVRIVEVDDGHLSGNSPYLVVRYRVLAGDQPGQEGAVIRDSLFLQDSKTQQFDQRFRWWLKICGLAQGAGKQQIDPAKAVGRELVIRVFHKKQDDGQVFANVPRDGLYPLNHSGVASVPQADTPQSLAARQQPSARPQPQPAALPRPTTPPARGKFANV